jgi:uncharacterized protein (DUF4415 family)
MASYSGLSRVTDWSRFCFLPRKGEGNRTVRREVRWCKVIEMVLLQPRKASATIRLDEDGIRHFRAEGPGWQTRVNAALRKVIGGEGILGNLDCGTVNLTFDITVL